MILSKDELKILYRMAKIKESYRGSTKQEKELIEKIKKEIK
jgi:hypothetical protein